jgi:hypothetical protein
VCPVRCSAEESQLNLASEVAVRLPLSKLLLPYRAVLLSVVLSASALAQQPLPLLDPVAISSGPADAVMSQIEPHVFMHDGPPHLVIESPEVRAAQDPTAWHGHGHPHAHGRKPPYPAAISGANRVPVWKQPYSYGHFGASHTRHWSLHHGHQRNYTQWTLR